MIWQFWGALTIDRRQNGPVEREEEEEVLVDFLRSERERRNDRGERDVREARGCEIHEGIIGEKEGKKEGGR